MTAGWVTSVLSCVALGLVVVALPARPASADLTIIEPAVAYHPSGFSPGGEHQDSFAEGVGKDLRLLRETGFRSLVTYAAEAELATIPSIARQLGFDGTIVMGVWDPHSRQELELAAAQNAFVDAYAVGNEGLGVRYEPAALATAMAFLRDRTGKPVTTTEPIDRYLIGPYAEWLLANSDWLFPLAHPFWAVQFDPGRAADWIIARHDYLTAITGRPVIFKELGLPTACDGNECSEDRQVALFGALERAGLPFFYFEAFDQPWKPEALRFGLAEAHWGLYDADRNPKQVVQWMVERQRDD